MHKASEVIKRKMNIRVFAKENTGEGKGRLSYSNDEASRDESIFSRIDENLQIADEIKFTDGFFALTSNGRIWSKGVVFIKKVLRKCINIFFGWYIFPIYQRRNTFNGKLLNAVSLLREEAECRRAATELLEKRNEELTEELHRLQTKFLQYSDAMDSGLLGDDFYHDFEEAFRGSFEEIVSRERTYVPDLEKVLPPWRLCRCIDVGSGRGEWLDILREVGATDYVGVDLNERQNEIARKRGHKVICADCIAYMEALPDASVDLITAFQLIEHFSMSLLLMLLQQCLRILKPGGVILFETQNARNLTVGANTFYTDPTHKRPVESESLMFIAKWLGFVNIKILDRNAQPESIAISKTKENEDVLTERVNVLSWSVFGPRDYAILAQKGAEA